MTGKLPKEISNLRLLWAFRNLAVNVLDCITESPDNPLYVIDDENKGCSRFISVEESIALDVFTAHNPRHHNLFLLAIDNRLLTDIVGGVADCALFSIEDFTFIEFKTNARGNSLKSVEYTYHKALKQIENTLAIFSRRLSATGIDFTNHVEVTAHVVVSPKFPRSSVAEQQLMVEFFDRNMIELSFDNHKTFD